MSLRERKKIATKMKIIEKAVELFKKNGYDQTSMEEIAESCMLSKGTIYNYFAEKRQLVAEYFELFFKQSAVGYIAGSNKSIVDDFKYIAEFYLKIATENKDLAKIYFTSKNVAGFVENQSLNKPDFNEHSMGNVIYQRLKKAQNENEIKKDISVLLVTKIFRTIIMNIMLNTLAENPAELNPDEMITQAYDLFFNGILEKEHNYAKQ